MPAGILAAAQGLLDFIYYAQYQSHTMVTLNQMKHAIDTLHANKDTFINLDIHDHFNISKLHSMLHYILSIQRLSTADG